MNRINLRKAALLVGIVLLFAFVLSTAAGFDAFTLLSGPIYSAPNYVWTGTATITNPQHDVCIGFPGADPALGDVHCTWAGVANGAFSCVVPLSHFSNNLGDTIDWQIFASPNEQCNGNTDTPASEDSGGEITPVAVSLSSFSAGTQADLTWLAALAAAAMLVLPTTVIVLGRRRRIS